jgi:lysozyme
MPPKTMSAQARKNLVEASEGLRLCAYRDCVGVLTIGYGHTSRAGAPAVGVGMKISQAQADEILARDLAKFEQGVVALISRAKNPVAQCEFDALVDLAFNVGLGAVKSSSLLRAYLAGDRTGAAQKFMDWNRAGGREVAGLTARRRRDRAWFLTGHLAPEPMRLLDDAPPETSRFVDPPDAAHARIANFVLNERTDFMKGYRTLIVGLALAVLPASLQYLGAVDWQNLIGPTGAFFVSGLLAIGMRAMTTTPLGKQQP